MRKMLNTSKLSERSTKIVFVFLLFFTISLAHAANRFSVASGNWNSTATWSATSGGAPGASVPIAGDVVTIEGNDVVTVTANAACLTLNFTTAAQITTLNINSGVTLTVSGFINLNRASTGMNLIAVGAGTLNAGTIAFLSTGGIVRHEITISTGTVTVTDVTTNSAGISGSITFTGAGLLQVAGQLMSSGTVGGTLTTVAGSTVEFNGAAQTARVDNYLGNLILSGSGAKSFAGAADVEGTLSIRGTATMAGTAATFGTSSTLEYRGSAAQTATNIEFPSGGPTNLTINNTNGVSLNGAKTITGLLTMTSGTLNMANNNVTVGSLTGSSNITNTTGAAGVRILSIGSDGTSPAAYSGIISNGTATSVGITKTGVGTLTLSGTNTFTGITTINAGKISVATIGNGGVAGNLGQATNAAANLVLGGGTLQYTGATASTNRNYILTTGTTSTIDITTNTLTISGASTATTGALSKAGAGTLILSGANLYTGLTTINDGTLSYGIANALATGAVTVNDGGTYNLNGFSDTIGTLAVNSGITGGTVTTGAGTLTLGGNVTSTGGAANALISGNLALGLTRTFTLTNAADGLTIAAAITGGGIGISKLGAGTLLLSGVNTYTGTTTVSGGTLALGTTNVIGTSAVVLSGGTFSSGLSTGYTDTVGTLGLTSSSTLDLGTGAHILTFAASNLVGWTTSQIITVTGWAGNYTTGTSGIAGQLFVGASAAGLTPGQLGQMQFFDGTNYYPAKILGSGEVVPFAPAATTYYAIASGAWNTNTTWSLTSGGAAVGAAIYPKAGDTVNIGEAAARAVTVGTGVTASCAVLNIGLTAATTGASTLTLSTTTSALNVTGNVAINKPSNGATNALNINDGTATIGGNVTFGGITTLGSRVATLVTTGGTVNISGDLIMSSGSGNNVINMTGGAGTINLAGVFTATVSILNSSATSTFNFNGAAQTVPAVTSGSYNNIILSGSGAKTIQTGTINNDLTLSGSGTATTAASLAIGGDLAIATGNALATGTTALTLGVAGTTSVTGTLTLDNTATKTFTGNVTINSGGVWNETGIAAINYAGNLQNDGTAFTANTGVHTFSGTTKTISGTTAIAIANLTISGTTTNSANLTVSTALAGASTFTNGATGTLTYGGATITPTLVASAVGNTVNYNGAGNQTLRGNSYSNLILSGSGTKTFAGAVLTTIGQNLSILGTAKATFPNTTVSTANSLTLGGGAQNSGTWGGTGSGATNINTVYFNGTTNGRINIATGACAAGLWTGATSTDWNVGTNWCGGAVPTASTDVVISGTTVQPSINSGTTAVCRNLTIAGPSTVTMANSATSLLNINGNFTNNGVLSQGAASIVSFVGASAQTLGGSATTTFSNLVINTATAPITVTNTKAFIATNVTVTRGNFILQATDANYTVNGNLTVSANGTLTHNVDWDAYGKQLTVTGNIAIDGIYTKGAAGRSHVQMNGSGKSIHTGSSSLNIVTLATSGAITADGALTVDNNFWAMQGITGGSFSTNGQTVIASGALINSGGSLNINGGSLTVTGGLLGGFNPGFGGTINLSAGTLTVDDLNLGASPTINAVFNHSGGTANISGTTTIIASSPGSSYICTGSPTLNVSGNWINNGTYTKATETVNFNGNTTISGSSVNSFHNVTISGTLIPASATNINVSGTWTDNGTFTHNSGTVTINGTTQQTLGGTATTVFNNLTISNTAGAILASDKNVNNTLSLTGGNFSVGTKILTMGATAPAISGSFSAARMIVADGGGEVRKAATSNATASYTFPIGDNVSPAEYTPIALTVTGSAYSSAHIGVSVADAKHPNNASSTHFLTRSWTVNQSGISSCSAVVSATFIPATDVTGTIGSIKASQLSGAFNQVSNPWVKGSALSGSPLTYTGTITAGQPSVFTGITSADPTVSISTGSITVCQNATASLSAAPIGDSAFTYFWTGAITGSANLASITPTTTSVGLTTSYSLYVKDANGISSAISPTVTVTVNALPVAGTLTPSVTPGAVCIGTLVSATATAGTGGAGTVTDELEVSLSGGAFNPYTTGTSINTTGKTSVSIRTRRNATGTGCGASTYNTVTWTVDPLSVGGSVTGGAAICSGSTSGVLTLAGNVGGIVRWESSVSPFSSWTPIVNTLATYTSGALTQTTQFRAVVQSGTCSSAVSAATTVSMGGTSTWNGTAWSPSAPTSTDTAIISGNYTTTALHGSISACTLTINSSAVVDITAGYDVTLNGALTVSSGSFTLEDNANLIQVTSAANSGNITVKRNSSALVRQDYTLWSSPVASQNLLAFSPATIATRFYTYNPVSDAYNTITPSTNNFADATGYLIRMPNTHPATATVWNGQFTGVPHNGNYPVNMTAGVYNLVGNPYPSPISMSTFVSQNSGAITGTLYFWRETNLNTSNNAYCTWAGGTFTSNGEAQVVNPAGIIQTGQGFIVAASSVPSTLTFRNTQRVSNFNDQFFRNALTEERNTIWLNATNTTGAFSQMAVGYITDATQGIDMFDGKSFENGDMALNSILDNSNYVIQGRALPFDAADVVRLSFRALAAGDYTIAIDHTIGLFEGGQDIYLKDNLVNTVHDLKTAPYTFTTPSGNFNNRFEIVYQAPLGTVQPIFNANTVIVYKHNQDLVIHTGKMKMANVKIYDIRGRLLHSKSNINASETKIEMNDVQEVLIVKITSEENVVVTKKVVN